MREKTWKREELIGKLIIDKDAKIIGLRLRPKHYLHD